MKESAVRGQKARTGARRVKVEISAGGIVFKCTPQGVRIAMILDPFAKWAFAKGHVEKGETVEAAALRETEEEMGLDSLRIVAPLGKIDFWFQDRYRPETKGVLVHKYVHYFLLQAPADAKGRPQKKERIRRVIWVSLNRAMTQSSYKDVQPILARVRDYFSGQERCRATWARKRRRRTAGGTGDRRSNAPRHQ